MRDCWGCADQTDLLCSGEGELGSTFEDVAWRASGQADVISVQSSEAEGEFRPRSRSVRDLSVVPDRYSVVAWLQSILEPDSRTRRFAYPSSGGLGHVGALAIASNGSGVRVPCAYVSGQGLVELETIGIEDELVAWAASKVTSDLPPWVIFFYSDIAMLRRKYSGPLGMTAAVEVGCVVQLAYERAQHWRLRLCASGAVHGRLIEMFRIRAKSEEPRLLHLATVLLAGE